MARLCCRQVEQDVPASSHPACDAQGVYNNPNGRALGSEQHTLPALVLPPDLRSEMRATVPLLLLLGLTGWHRAFCASLDVAAVQDEPDTDGDSLGNRRFQEFIGRVQTDPEEMTPDMETDNDEREADDVVRARTVVLAEKDDDTEAGELLVRVTNEEESERSFDDDEREADEDVRVKTVEELVQITNEEESEKSFNGHGRDPRVRVRIETLVLGEQDDDTEAEDDEREADEEVRARTVVLAEQDDDTEAAHMDLEEVINPVVHRADLEEDGITLVIPRNRFASHELDEAEDEAE